MKDWLMSGSWIPFFGYGHAANFVWFYGLLHIITGAWILGMAARTYNRKASDKPVVDIYWRLGTVVLVIISLSLSFPAPDRYFGMMFFVFVIGIVLAGLGAILYRTWVWVRTGE